MSCDVGKAAEELENELWHRWSAYDRLWRAVEWAYMASPTSELILQSFCLFTYVTAHSAALPLVHLHLRNFTYVTWRAAHAPMIVFSLIYPWWFCNLQWLRPAGLYEKCKLALELKRLKTPVLEPSISLVHGQWRTQNFFREGIRGDNKNGIICNKFTLN